MASRARRVAAAAACAATALTLVGPLGGPATAAAGDTIARALTADGRLLSFPLDDPGTTSTVDLTGIGAGERIIGIDERPKTGALYAVTQHTTDGSARIYTVADSGAATLAAPLVKATDRTMPVVLTGVKFGVDFNPVADALRIVGDDGQDLRALPSDRVVTGVQRFNGDTFVDGTLSYAPITSNPAAGRDRHLLVGVPEQPGHSPHRRTGDGGRDNAVQHRLEHVVVDHTEPAQRRDAGGRRRPQAEEPPGAGLRHHVRREHRHRLPGSRWDPYGGAREEPDRGAVA